MTGQGILLVGMMTEAVVTPWISDRDLALQNVRYVMNAAGNLREDFHPAPDGFIATRAREVLGEAIDLLEEIKARHASVPGEPPLLSAIADGTFGLMKRPADKGRGLDGVAGKAPDYYNPATEILEENAVSGPIRPYGDTTGDGMVQLSFTLPIEHSKVAEGAAVQLANKMGMDPALVVHAKPMGEGFTFFVVYGRVNHLVDPSTVEVVERDYPLLTPKEANAAIKRSMRRRLVVVGGCIGTDAHTVGIDAILNIKGFAGEKGLEYYRELKVVNLGAQVSVPAARRGRPRGEGRRRARLPGRHPARRPPAQHPRDVRGLPRGLPGRQAPAARRRRPPLRRDDGRRARRRPRLQPGYDAGRGRVVHRPPTAPRRRRLDDTTADVGTVRHPPPLRPLLPRPLRRQPRRRGLQPRPVRRRGHRDVHRASTATRGCSRPTPTCSSGRPCGPATSSRSPRDPGRAGVPQPGLHRARRRAGRGERRRARARGDARPAGGRHDRHGRRRRPVIVVP